MKKQIRKMSVPILIMVALIGILAYFTISAFITESRNLSLKQEIGEQITVRDEIKGRKIHYTDEDNEYFSLKQQLDEINNTQSNGAEPMLQEFLTSYDNAMDYNAEDFGTSLELQQEGINERFSHFFTETAFKLTEDYALTQMEETFTYPKGNNTDSVRKIKNRIEKQERKIICSYTNKISDDTYKVFLEIENKNKATTEYQTITLKSEQDNYLITDFKLF